MTDPMAIAIIFILDSLHDHKLETMVYIEPNFICQYHLSSSVRKWQNNFQQGVLISSDKVLKDNKRRF